MMSRTWILTLAMVAVGIATAGWTAEPLRFDFSPSRLTNKLAAAQSEPTAAETSLSVALTRSSAVSSI